MAEVGIRSTVWYDFSLILVLVLLQTGVNQRLRADNTAVQDQHAAVAVSCEPNEGPPHFRAEGVCPFVRGAGSYFSGLSKHLSLIHI